MQLEADQELNDIALMQSFISAGVRNNMSGLLNKKKKITDIEKETTKDFYGSYKLNLLADQYHFQRTRKTNNTYILNSQKQLDMFFVCSQLKMWCELLNRSNVLNYDYDKKQHARFESVLKAYLPDYANHPFVSLYYPVYKGLQNQDDDGWYEGYLKKLKEHLHKIQFEDGKEICNYIQNYCVKRINEGRQGFLAELFEIFKLMLNTNLAYEGLYLPQWTYKNIITVGLRLKEFTWTEDFIHQYYKKLAPDESDNAYQYNLAVLHYESGNFDRAMQLLNKVHFTDPNYYLDAKCILLKIYFQKENDDALYSLRDTVKIYLLREKLLNKNQKLLYKNLFTYAVRLFKLKYESAHLKQPAIISSLKKIAADLAKNNLVANKQWLMQKLEEVSAGYPVQ
jgi:tetratricopeptide (TPR) repeat protein